MLTIADIELLEKVLGDRERSIFENKGADSAVREIEKELAALPEMFKGIAEMKLAMVKREYEEYMKDEIPILRLRAKLLDMKEELILQNATAKL